MNIPHHHRRQSGLALAGAIILFVLFILFIGSLTVLLWRMIQKIHPRDPDPSEQAASLDSLEVVAAADAIKTEFAAASVTPVYVLTAPVSYAIFIPFAPVAWPAFIERSTNLIDWETVEALPAGKVYADTNPPPARAFYRRLNVNPPPGFIEDTNHVPYYRP